MADRDDTFGERDDAPEAGEEKIDFAIEMTDPSAALREGM
jgi:hypothetical protein